MKRSHLWISLVSVSTFVLALSAGCGGDNGSSPAPTLKPHDLVPAGFAAVTAAADGFLSSNEMLLASLDVLGPKMGASLRRDTADPMRPTEKAIQQSCIPTNAQDKVFKYDTTTATYVASADAGAPPGGARFTLYELDPTGAPMLPLDQHVVGFFDMHCEGQLPNLDSLTIWLVNTMDRASGVTVLNIALEGQVNTTASPTVFNFQRSRGFMHDDSKGNTTPIAVLAEGTLGSELKERFEITGGLETFDSRLSGFVAGAGRWDSSLGSSGLPEPPIDSYDIACTMEDPSGTELFDVSFDIAADGAGRIVNINSGEHAPLEFIDKVGSGSGILACLSDLYVDPVVDGAATNGNCATGTIDTPIPQSVGELDTYFNGYKALLDLLNTMTPIYGIAMEVLTP